MSSVVIAETDGRVLSALLTILEVTGCETTSSPSLEAAIVVAERDGIDVLVIGPSLVDEAALSVAENLRAV